MSKLSDIRKTSLTPQIHSGGLFSTRDNGTPYTIVAQNARTRPIRVMLFGDSLCSGLDIGPNMARAGYIGSGASALVTGGFSGGAARVDGDYNTWINGQHASIPAGGTATYSATTGNSVPASGSLANTYIVGYVREATAPTSFDIQTSPDLSTWTTRATITTAVNPTQEGAVATGTVSMTGLGPQVFFLRITNVVGGTLKVVMQGLVNQSAPVGAVLIGGLGHTGGLGPSSMLATPVAILNPIIAAAAPDLVLSVWDDTAEHWESGGAFRTMYSRMKTAFAATDWVQLSAPPCQDSTKAAGYELARAAQYAWAEEAGESYFDSWSIFTRGDWTAANTRGLFADGIHPSSAGYALRYTYLWNELFIGRIPLGRLPMTSAPGVASGPSSNALEFSTYSGVSRIWTALEVGASALRVQASGAMTDNNSFSLRPTTPGTLSVGGALEVIGTGGPVVQPITAGTAFGSFSRPIDARASRIRALSSGTAPIGGTATLVSGTVTINTTAVAAGSIIEVTRHGKGSSTAIGQLSVETITAGTSFVITSLKADATTETGDLSVVRWVIVDAMSS